MTTYKYRTGGYDKELIKRVEVVKETEKFLTVRESLWSGKVTERRAAKQSTYHNYHDTWDAAKQFLLAEAADKVRSARRSLELANSELGNIKGLKRIDELAPPPAQKEKA